MPEAYMFEAMSQWYGVLLGVAGIGLTVATLFALYYRGRAEDSKEEARTARAAKEIYRVGYDQQRQFSEELQRQRNEWVKKDWAERLQKARLGFTPGAPSVPSAGDTDGGTGTDAPSEVHPAGPPGDPDESN